MNIVTEMREVCPHDLFLHTEYMATERRTLSRAQMHTPPLSSPVKPGCQAKPGPPRPGQIEAICNHHSPWKQIEYRLHEQDLFQDRVRTLIGNGQAFTACRSSVQALCHQEWLTGTLQRVVLPNLRSFGVSVSCQGGRGRPPRTQGCLRDIADRPLINTAQPISRELALNGSSRDPPARSGSPPSRPRSPHGSTVRRGKIRQRK